MALCLLAEVLRRLHCGGVRSSSLSLGSDVSADYTVGLGTSSNTASVSYWSVAFVYALPQKSERNTLMRWIRFVGSRAVG